jgi:hypothetical protein
MRLPDGQRNLGMFVTLSPASISVDNLLVITALQVCV